MNTAAEIRVETLRVVCRNELLLWAVVVRRVISNIETPRVLRHMNQND